MEGYFTIAFRQQLEYLVNRIAVSLELWIKLEDREILTRYEIECCENEKTSMAQVRKMLEFLNKKDDEHFEPFCEVLTELGQKDVAGKLRENLESAKNQLVQVQVLRMQGMASKRAVSSAVNDSETTSATVPATVVIDETRGTGLVSGLTMHGGELFAVRYPTNRRVEVYNASNYAFQRYIQLPRVDNALGITSCDAFNCLYVGDAHLVVIRVELTGYNKVTTWKVRKGEPKGLFVNSQRNLLITAQWLPHKLAEYTTFGQLLREIILLDGVFHPWHAIQLDNGRFVVSHGSEQTPGSLHRVSHINAGGQVLRSYGTSTGSSEAGQLNEPRHLAVDGNGFVYVADMKNGRIVVLDSELEWSRDIKVSVGGGLKQPFSVYLDRARDLLLVGDWGGRVFVIKM